MSSQARVEGMAMQWRHEMTWSGGCITADVVSTVQLRANTLKYAGCYCQLPFCPGWPRWASHHPTSPVISKVKSPQLPTQSGEQGYQLFSTAATHLFPVQLLYLLQNHDAHYNSACNGYLPFSFLLSYASHTCLEQDFMDKYKIQIMKVYCKNAGTLLRTQDKPAPP